LGIAALYRNGEGTDVGELLQVWVSPEYRSQGVAIALMDAVFQWAGENGFRTVIATVTKGNLRALRLYQKYGFEPASEALLDSLDESIVLMKAVR
jgi:ribosomal protein S18 acetylase RimI-like enzyme